MCEFANFAIRSASKELHKALKAFFYYHSRSGHILVKRMEAEEKILAQLNSYREDFLSFILQESIDLKEKLALAGFIKVQEPEANKNIWIHNGHYSFYIESLQEQMAIKINRNFLTQIKLNIATTDTAPIK